MEIEEKSKNNKETVSPQDLAKKQCVLSVVIFFFLATPLVLISNYLYLKKNEDGIINILKKNKSIEDKINSKKNEKKVDKKNNRK